VGLLALHRAQSRNLPDDITDALDAAELEAGGETRLAVFVGRARAWANACAGKLRAGAELAAEVGRAAIDHDHIAWGATALHDAVRLGHPELVRTALGETVRATSGARFLEAMRDHAAALDENDPTQLDAAAGALARCGSPLLAAEGWAQLAQLHLGRQEPESACRAALRAELAHQQCSLAATPALDDIPESISARERSVVEEMLGGLTSRQIADRLYLSVRTVDNHLHTVYRKLGVSGRDELADLVKNLVPAGAGRSPASDA
jgi:DNA-binding NarL/FixJ family response regulator